MTDCPTCNGYQLVPGPDGLLVDCPNCHANEVRAWCPRHSIRLNEEGECRRCLVEGAYRLRRTGVAA